MRDGPWWRRGYAPYELDPSTKVGKGLCSACYCEEPAVFVFTLSDGKQWGTCLDHTWRRVRDEEDRHRSGL